MNHVIIVIVKVLGSTASVSHTAVCTMRAFCIYAFCIWGNDFTGDFTSDFKHLVV